MSDVGVVVYSNNYEYYYIWIGINNLYDLLVDTFYSTQVSFVQI